VQCRSAASRHLQRSIQPAADPRRSLPPLRSSSLPQKAGKAGNYALYPKPFPRYVECSTQGAFVMRCNGNLKWVQAKQNCV